MEKLLTAEQLAEALSVPLSYIRHRCHRKTIPFFKIGNHVRFRASEVENWLIRSAIRPDQGVQARTAMSEDQG